MSVTDETVGDRRKPAGLGPSTPVEKVLLPGLVDLHLGNVSVAGRFEAHRTGGFVTRLQDVPGQTADEVAAAHGVDLVPGWPRGGPLFVLRMRAAWPGLFVTSFGGRTAEAAAGMGSPAVYPAPFLGTGYTPYQPAPVPEYFLFLTELVANSQLFRIDPDGQQTRVGTYVHRRIGWIPEGGPGFGPSAWWRPPVPASSRVRRGLHVTHEGVEYEADFGPRTAEYTLHAIPGRPPAEGFTELHGSWCKVVDEVRCERAVHVRQLVTWRGAPFEIVDAGRESAALHYLGENHDAAVELGLVEVDYRQWRIVARTGELTDRREDETVIAPQGAFGR